MPSLPIEDVLLQQRGSCAASAKPSGVRPGPLQLVYSPGENWREVPGAPGIGEWTVEARGSWYHALVLPTDTDQWQVQRTTPAAAPFGPRQPPVPVRVRAVRLGAPSWQLDGGNAGTPTDGPVRELSGLMKIDLVPYGNARIRIAEPPVVATIARYRRHLTVESRMSAIRSNPSRSSREGFVMRVTQDMIDPELRLPAKLFGVLFGKGQASEAQVRSSKTPLAMRLVGALPLRGVSVANRRIPRGDGTELSVIVATRSASARSDRPGILWIHGGGYSIGTARGELMSIKELLGLTDAVFVSPDYRLSTEAPYPAALDDCYLALLWLKEHAAELGVRTDQIIVAGGSAGGGLTAAVTIRSRNEGSVNIAFQMPLYPMIDDRPTPSSTDNDAPLYDGTSNESGWKVYLGDLYGGDVPPTAAPARETDYRGLPPTLTFVGGIEPFRDETIAYVENLRSAGVPVSFREFKGAWHAFDALAPRAKVAKDAKAWKQEQFSRFLETYFAAQA